MRVAVIGAGPAGLLFAARKAPHPSWRIEVAEQNPEGATYGFGVVFSEGRADVLERDEAAAIEDLAGGDGTLPMQRIVHRDECVDIDGNGFSAIGRPCAPGNLRAVRDAGGRSIWPRSECARRARGRGHRGRRRRIEFVRASGAASAGFSRRSSCSPTASPGTADASRSMLTLTFRGNEHGAFVAHHYRHAQSMSTLSSNAMRPPGKKRGWPGWTDAQSRA